MSDLSRERNSCLLPMEFFSARYQRFEQDQAAFAVERGHDHSWAKSGIFAMPYTRPVSSGSFRLPPGDVLLHGGGSGDALVLWGFR